MSLKKLKTFVFNRAKGRCEYCKSPADISSQPFVMEHIVSQSKGGLTNESNLALSCQGCNNHKYDKITGIDPVTGDAASLFHPRQQIWEHNFLWTADVIEVMGTTPTGRATVDVLKMNRKELQNLRKVLSEVGKHPPE